MAGGLRVTPAAIGRTIENLIKYGGRRFFYSAASGAGYKLGNQLMSKKRTPVTRRTRTAKHKKYNPKRKARKRGADNYRGGQKYAKMTKYDRNSKTTNICGFNHDYNDGTIAQYFGDRFLGSGSNRLVAYPTLVGGVFGSDQYDRCEIRCDFANLQANIESKDNYKYYLISGIRLDFEFPGVLNTKEVGTTVAPGTENPLHCPSIHYIPCYDAAQLPADYQELVNFKGRKSFKIKANTKFSLYLKPRIAFIRTMQSNSGSLIDEVIYKKAGWYYTNTQDQIAHHFGYFYMDKGIDTGGQNVYNQLMTNGTVKMTAYSKLKVAKKRD